MPEAARTLVKSPPELWAEVSDPTALARHLGAFGDIRITRLEPEATVAWEGDRASGTVQLDPAQPVLAAPAPPVPSQPTPGPEPTPPDPDPAPTLLAPEPLSAAAATNRRRAPGD